MDPNIPMWTLKFDGQTEYVDHAEFKDISFSTKETPDNPHTKGSLKFKNVELNIENGEATVKGANCE